MQQPDQQSQATSRVRRHELLAADPRSASRARKVVEELLTECSLDELADTATLLVSELVTNVVLHAASPVGLRCHVEASTLCVQVGDRSPVLPGMRHYDDDAFTGRGLGMVELLAAAWGVEGGEHGKTVWFQLASQDADPHAMPAVPSAGHAEWDAETCQVTLLGLPAALVTTTVQYGDSVLRELSLMTMVGSSHTAPSWQGSHLDLGPLLHAFADLTAAGVATADVTIQAPAGSGAAAFEHLSLIEEGDRMAPDGTLLCPPALPEILACRRWLLSQYGLQEEGAPPQPWQLPNPLPPAREAAKLPPDQRRQLEELIIGALVADDANRIIYLNAAAETAIGWSATDHRSAGSGFPGAHPRATHPYTSGYGTTEPELGGRPAQRRHNAAVPAAGFPPDPRPRPPRNADQPALPGVIVRAPWRGGAWRSWSQCGTSRPAGPTATEGAAGGGWRRLDGDPQPLTKGPSWQTTRRTCRHRSRWSSTCSAIPLATACGWWVPRASAASTPNGPRRGRSCTTPSASAPWRTTTPPRCV